MTLEEVVSHFENVKSTGSGHSARCPAHEDQRNSLSVAQGEKGVVVIYCHAGCAPAEVLAARGLTFADLNGNGGGLAPIAPRVEVEYPYRDRDGREAYQVVRLHPKDFRVRRRGQTGWIWNLNGVERVLYRLPELLQASPETVIYLVEGEKDTDRLAREGLVATTVSGGASAPWLDGYDEFFRGRHVVILPDHDLPGVACARERAARLRGVAASVKVITLFEGPPGEKHGKDVSDWLTEGHDIEELVRIEESTAEWTAPRPTALISSRLNDLADVVGVFRKWLYLPDADPLYGILGAIAANRRPGDPIWLMVVGASSWGKSEMIDAATRVPGMHPAATITEGGLLSGTPNREKASEATGGLLREIGEKGIIVCKDFGSVLSMNRDARAGVLAALREVYDGSWTRRVGTDGGRMLEWKGKAGFIGGCTPSIDGHHAVMAAMGERFMFVRLRHDDAAEVARRALEHAGKEATMRRELSDAVCGLFAGLPEKHQVPELDQEEQERLIALATLSARCRSSVERDGRSREIRLIPGAESPGRLTRMAANLLAGLQVIGLPRPAAWRVIRRVVLDSMPMMRRTVLVVLARNSRPQTTAEVALAACYPSTTARRHLEDLAAYDIVTRQGQGQGHLGHWTLSDWSRTMLGEVGGFPEMSGDQGGAGEGPHPTT